MILKKKQLKIMLVDVLAKSVISYQLSVISYQLSDVSFQWTVWSGKLEVFFSLITDYCLPVTKKTPISFFFKDYV